MIKRLLPNFSRLNEFSLIIPFDEEICKQHLLQVFPPLNTDIIEDCRLDFARVKRNSCANTRMYKVVKREG